MEPAVLFDLDDAGIATITLNRPDMRNPISGDDVVSGICDTLAAMEANPKVRVAILTGAGKAFSSGGDINAMKPGGGGLNAGLPAGTRGNYKRGIQRIPLAFAALEVPVIAAVNGPAIGAGLDLACMCDLRIAGESAKFAESFVKLGIIPGDGGAWLLQRAIGYQRAAELSFTGDTIDAQAALAMGLVTRVVAPEALVPAAKELAARIAANSGPALRMAKRLLRQAQTARLDETLQLSAALQALAHHTSEHDAAVAAFFAQQKR